jgi:hypothetical protein
MERSQVVNFDVTNPEHRKDFVLVMRTKSFTKCKNRYTLIGFYGDVFSMMKEEMLKYYVEKEFSLNSK